MNNSGQRQFQSSMNITQYQQNKANMRKEKDVQKLMLSEFDVSMPN